MNDVVQYENDYIVQTKTRHRTPIVRTTSITNVDESNHPRHGSAAQRAARIKRASIKHLARSAAVAEHESGSSSPDPGDVAGGRLRLQDSDSSLDDDGAYSITLLHNAHHHIITHLIRVRHNISICSFFTDLQILRILYSCTAHCW